MNLAGVEMQKRLSLTKMSDMIVSTMQAAHVRDTGAQIVAYVLSAVDLRGIDSDGMAGLEQYFVDPNRIKRIAVDAVATTFAQIGDVDFAHARHGLGHRKAVYAMRDALVRMDTPGGHEAQTSRERLDHGIAINHAVPQDLDRLTRARSQNLDETRYNVRLALQHNTQSSDQYRSSRRRSPNRWILEQGIHRVSRLAALHRLQAGSADAVFAFEQGFL